MSHGAYLCPDLPAGAGCDAAKRAGDRVMIGRNRGPLYEVVHVAGVTAWVRGVDCPGEVLVPLANIRLAGADLQRIAA